jgi:hypothetical protein
MSASHTMDAAFDKLAHHLALCHVCIHAGFKPLPTSWSPWDDSDDQPQQQHDDTGAAAAAGAVAGSSRRGSRQRLSVVPEVEQDLPPDPFWDNLAQPPPPPQQQQQSQQQRRASLEYSEANWIVREAELQHEISHEQQKTAAAQAQIKQLQREIDGLYSQFGLALKELWNRHSSTGTATAPGAEPHLSDVAAAAARAAAAAAAAAAEPAAPDTNPSNSARSAVNTQPAEASPIQLLQQQPMQHTAGSGASRKRQAAAAATAAKGPSSQGAGTTRKARRTAAATTPAAGAADGPGAPSFAAGAASTAAAATTSVLPDFAAMDVDADLLGDLLGEPIAVGASVKGASQHRLATNIDVTRPC